MCLPDPDQCGSLMQCLHFGDFLWLFFPVLSVLTLWLSYLSLSPLSSCPNASFSLLLCSLYSTPKLHIFPSDVSHGFCCRQYLLFRLFLALVVLHFSELSITVNTIEEQHFMGSLQVHKYPPCLRGQLIRSKGQRHVVICDIDCFAVTLPPLSTEMFAFLIWLLF